MFRNTHRVSDSYLGLRLDPKSKVKKKQQKKQIIPFYAIRVSHYTLTFRENFLYIYIYIYIYIFIYIYSYYLYIYIYIYIHLYLFIYIYIHLQESKHICLHLQIKTHIKLSYAYIYIYIFLYIYLLHMCVCICICKLFQTKEKKYIFDIFKQVVYLFWYHLFKFLFDIIDFWALTQWHWHLVNSIKLKYIHCESQEN